MAVQITGGSVELRWDALVQFHLSYVLTIDGQSSDDSIIIHRTIVGVREPAEGLSNAVWRRFSLVAFSGLHRSSQSQATEVSTKEKT